MQAHRGSQRLQHGADDDDGRYGVKEASDHQERAGDETCDEERGALTVHGYSLRDEKGGLTTDLPHQSFLLAASATLLTPSLTAFFVSPFSF